MWKRRTFHECAEELEILSQDFRDAYTSKSRIESTKQGENLTRVFRKKVLKYCVMLALSIRSEQDFGILPSIRTTVGALNRSTNTSEVSATLNNYRPPYNEKAGFEPLPPQGSVEQNRPCRSL